MPSPILVSQPSPSLSLLAILRGFQLGILGVFRGLQNAALTHTHRELLTLVSTVLIQTVMIQSITWAPILSCKTAFVLIGYFTGRDYVKYMQMVYLVVHRVLNLNLLLVVFTKIVDHDICDRLLLRLLSFFDTEFATNLSALEREQLHTSSNYFNLFPMKLVTNLANKVVSQESLVHLMSYLKRYSSLILYNSFVCLIPLANSTLGTCIVGLFLFQNLINVTDIWGAALFTVLLSKLPFDYSISVVLCFAECHVYMHDLLLPYFTRVKFTNREKRNWIRSREGVLFGFTLCFYLTVLRFPVAGVIIIRLSEVSLGYLLPKLSDIPPATQSLLVTWSGTQIVWGKEKEQAVLTGAFVNETGFKPFPGSFIWG